MTGEGFAIRNLDDRTEMVVTGSWSPRAADAIGAGSVDRLVLNYAHGFRESDLGFLVGLPVRQLVIVDRRIEDLEALGAISEYLELLHLTTNPELQIDLTLFPRLTDVSADWRQIESTTSSATQLERLHIMRYRKPDLSSLGTLGSLRRLSLTDRPSVTSLSGLAAFPSLRLLGVYLARALTDISHLREAGALKVLELEGCRKISDLEPLRSCTRLRSLNISNCGALASLEPIGGLGELESLFLYGDTKILDGNLGPIVGLPRLKELRMQARRYYEPSVADVQALLPRKGLR